MLKDISSKQFIKYILIGSLGTGLDFLFLYFLTEYLHLFYVISAIISVVVVVWISFSLNKFWTFRNKEKKYFHQFAKYIISHAFSYGLNLAIMVVLVEIFGLWYIFAKVCATVISALCNFLLTKKWVFKKMETKVS